MDRAQMYRTRLLVIVALAVAVIAGATAVVAASVGAFNGPSATSHCASPRLSGSVVSVRLVDMRSMMGGHGPMMSQRNWRWFHRGMMRVLVSPSTVPHGTVSLRVVNTGYLTHELVVLPLARGQQPGTRAIGADGKVSEAGSRGEVSATCSAGSGEGIRPGTAGWTTLQLAAGRYELVCNLPGHYGAGMFAELDAS